MSSRYQSKMILMTCLILALFSGSVSYARTTPSRKLSAQTRSDLPASASLGLGTNSYKPSPALLTAPVQVMPQVAMPQQQTNPAQWLALAAPLTNALFQDQDGSSSDSHRSSRRRSRSLDTDLSPSYSSESSRFQSASPQISDTPLREDKDISSLSWSVTKSIENNLIGRNQGYSLTSRVGWAKLKSDGSLQLQGPTTSHCTSATHAQFLGTIGALAKNGKIKLSNENLQTLNSDLFRDAWNSDGYGPARLVELLGGQNFKEISAAQRGDFVKLDRKNKTGHTAIFSHISGNKICFWSSNSSTRGLGENCESLSNFSGIVFSRLNNLSSLQARLDDLGQKLRTDPALAEVRSRGGRGFVALNKISITQPSDLRSPAQIQLSNAGSMNSEVHAAVQ